MSKEIDPINLQKYREITAHSTDLTRENILNLVANFCEPLKKDLLDDLSDKEVLDRLKMEYSSFDTKGCLNDADTQRNFLIRHFQQNIVEYFFYVSSGFKAKNRNLEFSAFYDMAEGASYTFGSLLRAERTPGVERAKLDSATMKLYQQKQNIVFPIDTTRRMHKELDQTNNILHRLLQQDPTGFSVVDFTVEWAKQAIEPDQRLSIWPYNPEFFHQGTSLAALAYKKTFNNLFSK